MQKEFTKADLKDGMVVEERNKRKYIVLGDRVLNNDGYNRLKGYGNDLTDTQLYARDFDIIRVFKVKIILLPVLNIYLKTKALNSFGNEM